MLETSPSPDMAKSTGNLPVNRWRIEGALNLYTVEALRAQWLEKLSQPGRLEVDLTAVDACDCAGLQLLCSAQKSAAAAGVDLHLGPFSASVLGAADAIGLHLTELTPSPTPV